MSSILPALKPAFYGLRLESRWLPSVNSSLDFWRSNWLSEPLVDLLQIYDDRVNLTQGKISDFWTDGWAILAAFTILSRRI